MGVQQDGTFLPGQLGMGLVEGNAPINVMPAGGWGGGEAGHRVGI